MKIRGVVWGAAWVLLVLLNGCVGTRNDKLGAQNEFCQSDQDCRLELICELNICCDPEAGTCPGGDAPSDPNNDRNNDVNNTPNNTPNNDPNNRPPDVPPDMPPPTEIEDICKELCERVADCEGFEADDSCVFECSSELRGFEEGALCLLDLSCDELFGGEGERCFDDFNNDVPDDEVQRCFEVCDQLSACEELRDRCGDEVAEELLFVCFDLCESDPTTRSQVLFLDGLDCRSATDLVIGGLGLEDVCQ